MNGLDAISYVSNCVDVLMGLVLMAVGVGVVRPASATSGWLVFASGAISTLSVCCFTGLDKAIERASTDSAALLYAQRGLGLVVMIATTGLLIAAVATLPQKSAPTTDSRPPAA